MQDKPISSPSTDTINRRRGTMCHIIEFPKACASEAREAGLTIIFELDDRRLAIDWNITELNQKPGELIPIRRKRLWKRP